MYYKKIMRLVFRARVTRFLLPSACCPGLARAFLKNFPTKGDKFVYRTFFPSISLFTSWFGWILCENFILVCFALVWICCAQAFTLSSSNENSVFRYESIFSQRESSFGLNGSETKTMVCSYKKSEKRKEKKNTHNTL